jgi:hypothetical protein
MPLLVKEYPYNLILTSPADATPRQLTRSEIRETGQRPRRIPSQQLRKRMNSYALFVVKPTLQILSKGTLRGVARFMYRLGLYIKNATVKKRHGD